MMGVLIIVVGILLGLVIKKKLCFWQTVDNKNDPAKPDLDLNL